MITWDRNLLIFLIKNVSIQGFWFNITKFDGTFFHVWKYDIKLVLKSKKYIKIVEGLEIELVYCLATPSGTIHHLPPSE